MDEYTKKERSSINSDEDIMTIYNSGVNIWKNKGSTLLVVLDGTVISKSKLTLKD